MRKLNRLILKARVWRDARGQDMVEYALIAGVVLFAASSIVPGLSANISRVFSLIASEILPGGAQSQSAGS